jgi:ABC-type oligopeptide transport system substrate-binding subunit
MGFGQTPAYSLVPPSTWSYQPQPWAWQRLDDTERRAEAKRLYAEAGYSSSNPLHLRLLYNTSPAIKQTAIVIASMWKDTLGIDTDYAEEEYKVFLQSRHDRTKWEVVRLAWVADFNDASNFMDTLRAAAPNNDEGYSNPAFEQLLDQAAATPDVNARSLLLESSERTMLDDYPIIPLYHMVSKRLVKAYVHGMKPDPIDRVPTKALTLDASIR